jgi:hypothetical protein
MNEREIILAAFPQTDKILYVTPAIIEKTEGMLKELYLHHLGTPGCDPTIQSFGLAISFEPLGGKDDPDKQQEHPLAEYAANITRTLQNGNTCSFDIYPCQYHAKSVVAMCFIPDEDLAAAHTKHHDILVMYPKKFGSIDTDRDLYAYLYILAKPKIGPSMSFEIEQTLPYAHVIFDPNSTKIVCFESKKNL